LEKNMPRKGRIEMGLLSLKPSSLYSRFPGGSVGLALLVLRLVDALGLVGEAIRLLTPAGTSSEATRVLLLGLVLVASAILLMLGLRTSLAGWAAAICTAGAALHTKHDFHQLGGEMYAWSLLFALVFFLSSSLALMGPGGYSLDARLSGWRMIRLSPGQSNSSSQKEGGYVDR
jgi:uncharacterized membrane protein YphA (DoxX/SURF4 family)